MRVRLMEVEEVEVRMAPERTAHSLTGRRESSPRVRLSVDRQVRIVVGVLVLAGLLVPKLVALSYLMGIGLVFAGLTDTCGLALVLERMPWNRGRRTAAGERR